MTNNPENDGCINAVLMVWKKPGALFWLWTVMPALGHSLKVKIIHKLETVRKLILYNSNSMQNLRDRKSTRTRCWQAEVSLFWNKSFTMKVMLFWLIWQHANDPMQSWFVCVGIIVVGIGICVQLSQWEHWSQKLYILQIYAHISLV